jgi:predicted ribosome quality control (RQC) complex YloA/Tae2 family protein
MYFDALTLRAIAEELRRDLIGGRVQDVLTLDEHSVGLEIYAGHARHYLLLSADALRPRVYRASAKLRRGTDETSPLLLRLRKELEGAHLMRVEQPPGERVLALVWEGAAGAPVTLLAECMERRANLVLVANGLVLECARRVGHDVNRARVTLPGQPYQPPPPQRKLDAHAVTPAQLAALLDAPQHSALSTSAAALVAGLRGISPLAAREAVYRACGRVDERPAPEALHAVLAALLVETAPSLAWDGEELAAFAPYTLTHLANLRLEHVASASLAVERYDGASAGTFAGADAYAARKQGVRAELDSARARLTRKRDALQREIAQAGELERLRQAGELLLTYAHTVRPGQRELRAAYGPDEPEQVVALDPRLSAVQNAQDYFHRYEKAKSAARDLPARLAVIQADLDYLSQLYADLDLAESFPGIDEVRQALSATGWLSTPPVKRRPVARSGPLRVVSPAGVVIWVGRNARQNDELTFKRARPDDLWLHVREGPGAHVVIACGGQPVAESALQQAAALAVQHSPRRGETGVAVVVTARRYVRRVPGGRPGLVTYRHERTVST